MSGQPDSNGAVPLSDTIEQSRSLLPRATTWTAWTLFVLSVGVLVAAASRGLDWSVPGLVAVDGLTALMWVVVAFFSGVVQSYSRRYMAGEYHADRFFARVLAFTLAGMTLVAADHVALFAGAWLAMGLVMASLIGLVRGWPQARAAGALARRYFVASTALLAVGLATLSWATGTTAISGILAEVWALSRPVRVGAVAALVLAAVVQSALFPFHRWLLSSMTAPTPASALMHAGFVNAGGVLLTRFAPALAGDLAVMTAVVAVGAVSALFGQATLLVRTDVKGELGASTMAQMGFMILQCGLGFFAAAIAHLLLHGFYKAYLFLSAGAAVEQTAPGHDGGSPGLAGTAAGLLTAVGAAALFAVLTGKGTALDSGLVLTVVVALTALTAARDLLGRGDVSPWIRYVATPLVVLTAVGGYAVLFEAVSALLADVPATKAPTALTPVHYAVLALFGLAYAATEFGWHRASKRLYVALLNASQPAPQTVLTSTEDYDDA